MQSSDGVSRNMAFRPLTRKFVQLSTARLHYLILLLFGLFLCVSTAEAQNNLTLSATATPDPVRPGEQVTFTFTATNQGDNNLSGVELSTTVPGFVESFSEGDVEANCNGNCDPGESMEWSFDTLPAGQSQSVTFAATVKSGEDAPPEEAVLTSSGSVSADNGGGASASISVTARSAPAATLGMTADDELAVPGEAFTYTLKLANPSETDLTGVVMRAPVPVGTSFVSASGSGILESGEVKWTVGSLKAGEISRRTFTVMVNSDISDTEVISGSARINDISGDVLARATTLTDVSGGEALVMQASSDPDPAVPGGQVTFAFTAANQGDTDLSDFRMYTTVPGFVESFSEGDVEANCNGNCDPGESMEWSFDTLPAGQSQSVTFSAILRTGDDAPPENTLITSSGTASADEFGGAAATTSILASTDSYRIDETVDGRFNTLIDEENGTYTVTVQLKSSPGETDIGTSTVRFAYNQFALEFEEGSFDNYSGTQPSFTGGSVTYSSTISEPEVGEIALDIEQESSTDGNGQALTSEWTDVATLTFNILDPNSVSGLNWPTQDIYSRLGDPDGRYRRGEFVPEETPLPVELTAFEAAANGEEVTLTWQTASETNNAGFHVERSLDGDPSFEEVHFIEGAGTTNEAKRYQFTDEGIPFKSQMLTYRLRQVDLDGTTSYSQEVEVDLGAPDALSLHGNFPNPFRGQTAIRYELPQVGHVTLRVYDMLGREVIELVNRQQEAGRKEIQFDASRLASGTYFYRLNVDGVAQTQKMVVVK
jgi:uncharacterized repeat protein (TIGR01451 family)